jgi:hypothetical protein
VQHCDIEGLIIVVDVMWALMVQALDLGTIHALLKIHITLLYVRRPGGSLLEGVSVVART